MTKKSFYSLLVGILACLPLIGFGVDVPMRGMVGAAGSIHDAAAAGEHDPSALQSNFVDVGTFQVDSAYLSGFTITATLQGTGWSHYGTGTTQDTDFNVFSGFRLNSTDSSNYNGANSMSSILPTWGTVDTSPRTMSNGAQTAAMTNWQVSAQATWDASADLLPGAYVQTLSVTIAEGS